MGRINSKFTGNEYTSENIICYQHQFADFWAGDTLGINRKSSCGRIDQVVVEIYLRYQNFLQCRRSKVVVSHYNDLKCTHTFVYYTAHILEKTKTALNFSYL